MVFRLLLLLTVSLSFATSELVLPLGRDFVEEFAVLPCSTCGDGVNGLNGVNNATREAIRRGLDAGKELAKRLISKQFLKTVVSLAVMSNRYLAIIAPVALALINSQVESEELKFMKSMMNEINTGFSKIDQQFAEVRRLIDWSSMQVKFSTLEQKIRAAQHQIALFNEADEGEARENQQKILVQAYESDFQNSAFKLYDAMTNADQVFSKNLFEASRKYTQNYRTKVRDFMTGLVQLLMQGIQAEIHYYTLKGYSTNIPKLHADWMKKIEVVQDRMNKTDTAIFDTWRTQLNADVADLLKTDDNKSPKDFSRLLVNKITNKYFWRTFAAVVSKKTDQSWEYAAKGCYGTTQYGNNLAVVVGSKHVDNTDVDDNKHKQIAFKAFDTVRATSSWFGNAQEYARRMEQGGGELCKFVLSAMVRNTLKPAYVGEFYWGTVCGKLKNCFEMALYG